VFAVDDISFEVEEGEFFTLLGPSGCGKTTTLRSIAGLEQPESGQIAVDGRTFFDQDADSRKPKTLVPANERSLGMVFQSYAIWPHMTVFGNVAFPLEVGKRSGRPNRKVIEEKVRAVLEVMELGKYADRRATQLSGGQQQRLALARALVTEPRLLLLDEPLSNLDAKLRESLRFELKRLQHELGITSIYVTHDQVEALALSSRIAVMRDGKIMQLGKPRDIYENPNSEFVAEFIGTSNLVTGKITGRDGDLWAVDTALGRFLSASATGGKTGAPVIVSMRPESLTIETDGATDPRANQLRGRVVTRAFLGDAMDHIVDVGGVTFRVRTTLAASILPDTDVLVSVDPESVNLVSVQ
jgi:iron(III) transport system ATP-binding protein